MGSFVDTQRFANVFGGDTAKEPKKSAPTKQLQNCVEEKVSWKGSRAGVVWCYFPKGLPRKYTGNLDEIQERINQRGFPCLALVHTVRPTKVPTYWTFFNVKRLVVAPLGLSKTRMLRSVARHGQNDKFAIVQYDQNNKIIKTKHYRQMPKAFPRDFLEAVDQ